MIYMGNHTKIPNILHNGRKDTTLLVDMYLIINDSWRIRVYFIFENPYIHIMKQLITYHILLLFSFQIGLAQSSYLCNDELKLAAYPTKYEKPQPLEADHGFEADSLHIVFDDEEILDEGRAYVYIINTKKHDVFFRDAHPYLPQTAPIIQEVLDSSGNWIAIEHFEKNTTCVYPQMEYLKSNTYIAFTKRIYKDGDVCTKIRFKFTGRDEVFYSESYEGCVHQCQIDNSFRYAPYCTYPGGKGKPWKARQIYNSDLPIDEKAAQIKALLLNDYQELCLQTIMILYKKNKDYKTAFSYAEQLEKLNTGSGKCFMYKGDLYAMSAKECGDNMFEQRVVIIAAMEEWEKALQFEDTKAEAKKRIKMYSSQLPERPTSPWYNRNQTYYIGCWIDKTIKIIWK